MDAMLYDVKKSLEDALSCEDWKCVEEALDMVKEILGELDDEDDLYSEEI